MNAINSFSGLDFIKNDYNTNTFIGRSLKKDSQNAFQKILKRFLNRSFEGVL